MGTLNRDESGQIIVVAALLLAVLFVGLALVLNSAIYTENMATRGDTSTAEAMSTEGVTAERLGHSIDDANYGVEEASYAERRSRIESNASEWDRLMGEREARHGRTYASGVTRMTNGTRVNQSSFDYFEPADSSILDADPLNLGSSTNWQAINDSSVRAFEMRVRRGSLRENESSLSDEIEYILSNPLDLDGTDRFWVEFENDDSHRVYLLNDQKNDSVATVVVDGGNDLVGVCKAAALALDDNVTVRITETELEGADGTVDCPALEVVDDGCSDVYYAGTDHVEGTYRFVVDRNESDFRDAVTEVHSLLGLTLSESDVYRDDPNDEDPYTTTSIYGISVETTYRDNRISFTRNVTYPATAR